MKTLLLLLAGLSLVGCVQTRAAQTVALKQAGDTDLSCEQIAIEYKTNTEVALQKIARNRSADTQDILVGFFIWPGLADFQNADGTEGNALLDRNVYLREIGKHKTCSGMEHWPIQPERYTHGSSQKSLST